MDSIKSMVDLQKIDSKLDKLNNNIQKINEELANKNKLNINIFLHEQCKDALTMNEFIDKIKICFFEYLNFLACN